MSNSVENSAITRIKALLDTLQVQFNDKIHAYNETVSCEALIDMEEDLQEMVWKINYQHEQSENE